MNRRAFITLLGGTGVARGGAGAGADDAAGWLPPRRRAHDATVGRTVTLAKRAG